MPARKGHAYLRTHQLRARTLEFRLSAEEEALQRRAQTSRAGRAAKTLVKEGPLRLTVVALRKGTGLPSHQVAGPVTIQPLRGRLRVSTKAGAIDLAARGLLALDAGVVHSAEALDNCSVLLTVVMS